MKIQIPKPKRDELCIIANQRTALNRSAGTFTDAPTYADIEGILGEYAFCMYAGIDTAPIFDTSLRSSLDGTDSGDAVYNGMNIDVKTTKYANGSLLIKKYKLDNPNIDAYVLITGYFGRYEFKGFITVKEIKENVHLYEDKGDYYKIEQRFLKCLPKL